MPGGARGARAKAPEAPLTEGPGNVDPLSGLSFAPKRAPRKAPHRKKSIGKHNSRGAFKRDLVSSITNLNLGTRERILIPVASAVARLFHTEISGDSF